MKLHEKETVTCAEMKELERLGDAAGLPYYQMMENAGTCSAKEVMAKTVERGGKVVVFCGKGNNGGDGLVVSRLLEEKDWDVTLVLVEGLPVTVDSKTNYQLLQPGIKVVSIDEIEEAGNLYGGRPNAVVDSLYGTGFKGQLRESGAKAVRLMNELGKNSTLFALDIPSGLPGDEPAVSEESGETVYGDCVRADFTLTFHAKKPVHSVPEAAPFLGEVIVEDIGIGAILAQAE